MGAGPGCAVWAGARDCSCAGRAIIGRDYGANAARGGLTRGGSAHRGAKGRRAARAQPSGGESLNAAAAAGPSWAQFSEKETQVLDDAACEAHGTHLNQQCSNHVGGRVGARHSGSELVAARREIWELLRPKLMSETAPSAFAPRRSGFAHARASVGRPPSNHFAALNRQTASRRVDTAHFGGQPRDERLARALAVGNDICALSPWGSICRLRIEAQLRARTDDTDRPTPSYSPKMRLIARSIPQRGSSDARTTE
jgi:hypothetical protein